MLEEEWDEMDQVKCSNNSDEEESVVEILTEYKDASEEKENLYFEQKINDYNMEQKREIMNIYAMVRCIFFVKIIIIVLEVTIYSSHIVNTYRV